MLHIDGGKKRTSSPIKYFLTAPFYIWSMFFVDYACAECQEEVKILPRSSHEFRIVRSLYIFENDTKKCDEAEFLLVPSRAPFCDSHDLSVTFSSVAVLPNGTNM